MLLEKAFKDFIEYHEIDNQSEYTLRNYRRYVGPFVQWLQSEHNITDTDGLEVKYLRAWISHLQKTPSKHGGMLKDSTVRLSGVNVLAFCHWLEFEGTVSDTLTKRFKLPRTEKHFIPTFTEDEVKKLFDACDDCKSCPSLVSKAMIARNKAILAILFDAGIRLSELVGLRLCDIDRDMRILLIHRKGNKWQQVPVSREGFKYLHEYLTKHRKHLVKSDDEALHKEAPVFLSKTGNAITIHAVQHLFKQLKEKTGIDGKRVSAHNARRYMATTQLAAGRSPLDVQRQMGHSSLTMTNHYASLSVEHLQKSHEQFSTFRKKGKNAENNNHGNGSGYWEE